MKKETDKDVNKKTKKEADKDKGKDSSEDIVTNQEIKLEDVNFDFNFDWDKLKAFIQAVEDGSFNSSATKLGIKQSSLSRQVGNLEKEIGVKLGKRTHRGFKLIETGELLYGAGKKILVALNEVKQPMYEAQHGLAGKLHIVVYGNLIYKWLMSNIHKFREDYPEITFEITNTDQDPDPLISEVDLVIRFGSSNLKEVTQLKLFSGQYAICTTQKYIDKFGMPKNAADLANHSLIVRSDALLKMGCPKGKPHKPSIRTNNTEGILEAVLNNNGIGLLPKYILPAHPELIAILENEPIPSISDLMDIHFCYAPELKEGEKRKAFCKFLAKEFKTFSL